MDRSPRSKRALDLALAVPALVALAPAMAFIAVVVLARMGRPVLFRQQRPGPHGEPFTIVKFRTMREHAQPGQPDSERITPLGQTLRRWSLDELPELWCVVRGDMSIVGPRPLKMEYLDRYSPEQARRHEVPPGLTGWAQIHGRNDQPCGNASPSTCGTSTTGRCGWICASSPARWRPSSPGEGSPSPVTRRSSPSSGDRTTGCAGGARSFSGCQRGADLRRDLLDVVVGER